MPSRKPWPSRLLVCFARSLYTWTERGGGRIRADAKDDHDFAGTAYAGVAELVDAGDLKSPARKSVRVRVPPPAVMSAMRAQLHGS